MNIAAVAGAVEHLLGDAGLLIPLLAGVGVVRVDDDGGMLQTALAVELAQLAQILVVVVRQGAAVFVHRAAQDGVGEGVALAAHLPLGEEERVPVLGGLDGVHHDRQVAARGVLHADGDVEPAGDETVLLILDGTRADSDVGENVRQVQAVFRVEQLVRAGKARLLEYLDVHFARRDQTLENVRVAVRVGLVEHALVARAVGARLVRVDARDDQDLILDLFLQGTRRQT